MLKTPEWHWLIVWYFFLGGIAGGAYFTAAIADNFGSPRDRSVVRIGYILALLMIGICGMLLILDLGTPSRFLNMITHFNGASGASSARSSASSSPATPACC
jgi:formate-dependent nitrite reductase membrane component NrfD